MRRMAALMVALATVAGSLLMAPGVQAAPALSIGASRTTLAQGGSVDFAGRSAAGRGVDVDLQRQTGEGWRTVRSRRTGAQGAYSFTVTPPKGHQSYRVRQPRQAGVPSETSRSIALTVLWRPVLSLGEVTSDVDPATHAVHTTAAASAPGVPSGTVVRRELRQPDGTWAQHGSVEVGADHSWTDTFSAEDGWRVRYRLPADGARLAATSPTFTVDGAWTPTIAVGEATMDPLTDVVTVTGATEGLGAGEQVVREWLAIDGIWQAVPGSVSVGEDGSFSQSFPVRLGLTYRYAVSARDGYHTAAASTPFSFSEAPTGRAEVDRTTVVVIPAGATQRRLLVHLDQGQTVTYDGPGWISEQVLDPSGAALPGFGPANATVTWTAADTGDYTVVLDPPGDRLADATPVNVTLSTPIRVDTALDAPATDYASTLPGQVVDLQFAAVGGRFISEHVLASQAERWKWQPLLLDPTGAEVAEWGGLVRQGQVWRLPDVDGTYTLRLRPAPGEVVTAPAQSILSAIEVDLEVDGGPGHLTFDRQNRIGIVDVTVPAGLRLRISDTGRFVADEQLFGPDGKPVFTGSNNPVIAGTTAGTYRMVVSSDVGGEADYYASTPVSYDAEVGSLTSFDVGPAPLRIAEVTMPVTAGQTIGFEVLDADGAVCPSWLRQVGGTATVEWVADTISMPSVVSVSGSGDLVLELVPCPAGVFRPQLVASSTSAVTDISAQPDGSVVTTIRADLSATAPGQVMMTEVDAGSSWDARRTSRLTDSTFVGDTAFDVEWCRPTSSVVNAVEDYVPGAYLPGMVVDHGTGLRGPQYFFVYAGPDRTGAVSLELARRDS